MPAPIDESIKRKVIQQWISGESRDKIAEDNNIGAGSVSSIIANYKVGLETLDFDSIRQLSIEIRKRQLNWSDLASHFRLYRYFKESGAAEDKIESFIANVSSCDVSPEKVIELVNELFDISKSESIPLDQVSAYIKKKLEEKQKIDEQIKEADSILQSKNVNIETINEHIQLNERLNAYGLSTHNIDEFLNLLSNAKDNGFDGKKIVGKLRKIKRLKKKEEGLKNNCTIFAKQLTKYKEITPLAELIHSMNISGRELMLFKIALNETAETYGLTPSAAALDVINLIKDHNKKGQLKQELSSLYLQKYAVNEFCSRHSQVIMALANLKSHGITNEQIILLNNLLADNAYKASSYTVQTDAAPNSQFQ
jgi:hypothetical protein